MVGLLVGVYPSLGKAASVAWLFELDPTKSVTNSKAVNVSLLTSNG
jgi:hypothetical protein